MIAHEHVLKCINLALESPGLDPAGVGTLEVLSRQSLNTIHTLAEEVLATVPQSFGDIDSSGCLHDHAAKGPPRCRAIGAYFQLWPVKLIGGTSLSTTETQRSLGKVVFERIREYTGMRSHLGDVSRII
ncbi:hypothetical protein GGR57DRAFT_194091 [Xylariaceae sp. FL1272]|nr:hypothetical protein GGR57DRAFT_194091 [Xylariaceae sp. FL1272]